MSKQKIARGFVQLLATLSYFVCTMQWFWFGVLLLGVLSENGVLDSLNHNTTSPAPIQQAESVSPLMLVVGGIVTVLMLAVTIVVLVRLPRAIVNTSRAVTQHTAQAVVPVVLHHKKLPKKKKLQLTAKVVFYIRVALGVLPFLLLFILPSINAIQQGLVVFIGGFMAITTLTLLGAESVLNVLVPDKKR